MGAQLQRLTGGKDAEDITSGPAPSAGRKKKKSAGEGIYSKLPTSKGKTYVAIYDYEARSLKELSFNIQDTFKILECPDPNWWKVQALTNNHQGYIPSGFVVDSSSLSSKPWYFDDCKRREAESALVLEHNPEGAFLIRVSETNPNIFSMSIKLGKTVKHYRINKDKDGLFFVSKTKSFTSLDDLVDYYKQNYLGQTVLITQASGRNQIYEPVTGGLAFSTIDQWELDRSQIELGKEIGSGNFGNVYIGTWDGRVKVAVKTLKTGTMQPEAFLEEAKIMKKLRHNHLVQIWGVCSVDEPMYIVTEFMTNGSLQDYLRKMMESSPLEFHVQVNFAAQVATGMAFLEKNKYIHRDLAARNVLVGDNHIVKVADFGLSRLIDDGIYISTGSEFPIKWTAPEACSHREFTIKTDVWSFGILLYEIVTHGGNPYPTMSNGEALQQVNAGYRMPKPKGCQPILYDIMLDTWKKNPNDRPTFETLQWKLDDYFTLEGSEYVDDKVIKEQLSSSDYDEVKVDKEKLEQQNSSDIGHYE